MSSDLCKKTTIKKPEDTKKTNSVIRGCTDPTSITYRPDATKDDGSCKYAEKVISGKSLRSKHLKIVVEDLYDDGSPASNVIDPIRGEFFNHYGSNLNEFARTYNTRDFQVAPSPDDIYYDVPANREAKAEAMFNDNNIKTKEFTYINFTLNVPFSEREVRANQIQSGRSNQDDPGFTGADPRVSTYKFEPRYNFYLKEYEDKIADAAVDVRAIPNSSMYNFLVESLYDRDTRSFDGEYLTLLSYSDTPNTLRDLITKKKLNFFNYIEKYVVPATNLKSDSVPVANRKKFNNLYVTQDDIVEYNQFVENDRGATPFGFYLEIPFETPKLGGAGEIDDFKKVLKETNKDLDIYSIVVDPDVVKPASEKCYVSERFVEATTNTPTINFSTDLETFKSWDFTTFFQDYINFTTNEGKNLDLKADGEATVIGETNEAIQKYQTNSTYGFFKDLMSKVANTKFADIEDKKNLSPVELFGAYGLKETPYEVLFYRIEKKDKELNTLQNYIIANPFEEGQFKDKIVKFFDTQVKYGEKYIYDVYAYPLVLAKKYTYEKQIDQTRFTADLIYKYYIIFHYFKALMTVFAPQISANIKKAVQNEKDANKRILLGINALQAGLLTSIDQFYKIHMLMVKSQQYKRFTLAFKKELQDFVKNYVAIARNALTTAIQNNTNIITQLKADLTTFMTGRAAGSWAYSSGVFKRRYATRQDPSKREFFDYIMEVISQRSYSRPVSQLTSNEKTNLETLVEQFVDKILKGWELISTDGFIQMLSGQYSSNAKNNRFIVEYFNFIIAAASSIYEDKYGSKPGSTDLTGTEFDAFKIVTTDYVPLLEVKLFTEHGIILDGPPVAPQVSFVPFKDVDNRIAIKLKSQNTEYYAKPEPITKADETEIQNMIDSRGTDKQGRLLYKTDDYLSRFEIYRMDERPKSYRDFAPHLRKRVDLQDKYSSFTHHDKIEANKKYYYTFRSFDAHGHYSNPSPVYEFILNNDGGFLFPEIRIIDFETSDHFQLSTTMQKYIQIKPSSQNIILNPELIKDKNSARDLDCEEDASIPPPLGIASNGVWGKNFKLRITSKTSGKKVDINFNFEKNHKRE